MENYSICIIGNSHIAALKQAWTNRKPPVARDSAVTFFAAGTHLLPHLKVEGRVLVSRNADLAEKLIYTSGGLDRIAVDRYDIFVLVGMGFGIDIPRLCSQVGMAEHLKWGPIEQVLSRAAFDSMMEASFENSASIALLDKIRSISAAPTFIYAAPYRSEKVLEETEYCGQPRLRDPVYLESVVTRCQDIAGRVAACHGVDVLWQNPSTVSVPGFMKIAFGMQPLRFTMKGFGLPEYDGKHGNEEYGFIALMDILHRVNALSGGRVFDPVERTVRSPDDVQSVSV